MCFDGWYTCCLGAQKIFHTWMEKISGNMGWGPYNWRPGDQKPHPLSLRAEERAPQRAVYLGLKTKDGGRSAGADDRGWLAGRRVLLDRGPRADRAHTDAEETQVTWAGGG